MDLKTRLNKIKPEHRLPLVGAAVVVLGGSIWGASYTIKNNSVDISETIDSTKESATQIIDDATQYVGIKALEAAPAAYIDNLSAAIALDPVGFADYKTNLDTLTMVVTDSKLVGNEMVEYVFKENAGLVPVEVGLETCAGIYEAATPEQQMEVLLAQISGLETNDYGPILKELGAGVFDQVKNFFGGN